MQVLLFLSACLCASALANSVTYYDLGKAEMYFEDYIVEYGKQYADENEKAARFEIFKANLKEANRLNSQSNLTDFGITQFTDLTPEEFTNTYTGLKGELDADNFCDKIVQDVPDSGAPESLDWRTSNIVSRVKHQSTCGSCYSFSTTGLLESQYARKYGQRIELSEQQIIDCDNVSQGCQAGFVGSALKTLMKLGGSMREQEYPYENQKGQCRSNPQRAVVRVLDCTTYQLTSQEKVKQLLHSVGPITIGVPSKPLQGYTGGILTDETCVGKVDHAVLLVGYGTERNVPYWIVKNSWGAEWAEGGYFRMQRSQTQHGACGILNPVMTSAIIA